MQDYIFSWISILSWAKFWRVLALLDAQPADIMPGGGSTITSMGKRRLSHIVRRLDICLVFTAEEYGDNNKLIMSLARLITGCPNLQVLVTDLSIRGVDCQRTSPVILDSIKVHTFLRRLDFAGHEGPALEDYILLIAYLPNLEQLTTGRIAEPRMEREQLLDALNTLNERRLLKGAETTKVSWPFLHTIQLSLRPVHSSLRLLQDIGLPHLRRISMKTIDFFEPRVENFFSIVGHQLTHIYTYDIRSDGPPHGYRRLLEACPNLLHLTFAVRQDDRHSEPWAHQNLQSLGLRNLLPKTMPEREFAQNVSHAILRTLGRIILARKNDKLPCLRIIKMEDEGTTPLQFMKIYGAEWARECDVTGILLVESYGRQIPGGLPAVEYEPNVETKLHRTSKRAGELLSKVRRRILRPYRE